MGDKKRIHLAIVVINLVILVSSGLVGEYMRANDFSMDQVLLAQKLIIIILLFTIFDLLAHVTIYIYNWRSRLPIK